ncbi:methyl-viologen-reducing hydrogenase subunit delta [candidate division WOR-3 bacterium 4484_100]|uniref:Methyl-viologen-reducing hydrogenase subunit delta n=1 Tax=candidate division WOR-3 bacterium 4484_100 TaxID=1936077 RepID=A0A1V4QFQ3_UNCW3|nr:MAG: methyl-viologen-reducing hydrogenase subunit delta [candidate division WOR-3 bacterium 4484_100]
MKDNNKPKIIAFCCNWCSYAGADAAGTSRLQMKPHFRIIRSMCSSRIDLELILEAFSRGAWGILVTGCHPGDCHYVDGNYKTLRRITLLKSLLDNLGIEPQRVRLEWISANEGGKFQKVVNEFIDEIERLGPIKEEVKT